VYRSLTFQWAAKVLRLPAADLVQFLAPKHARPVGWSVKFKRVSNWSFPEHTPRRPHSGEQGTHRDSADSVAIVRRFGPRRYSHTDLMPEQMAAMSCTTIHRAAGYICVPLTSSPGWSAEMPRVALPGRQKIA
jgi:hypothetical protein